MPNFIAFRFTDNDFHTPLQQAIEFIVDSYEIGGVSSLTIENLSSLAVSGMYAYHLLRNVANNRIDGDSFRLLDYLSSTLKVSAIDKMTDLDSGFEGYVIDLHTGNTFYQGY